MLNRQLSILVSALLLAVVITAAGQDQPMRIGVIDLEGKLYTKLPIYLKEAEEAYIKFI